MQEEHLVIYRPRIGDAALPFTRELLPGISGSGNRIWIVQTVTMLPDGRKRYWSEHFESKAEAEHWIRWS